ncbi:amidohydrolase family protein [Methanopyrus sp.]
MPLRRVKDGVLTAEVGLVGRDLELLSPMTIEVEDGRVRRIEEGREPCADDFDVVLPAPFNAHVHAADWAFRHAGLGMPLEKVVAPPDGLKHRLLEKVGERELEASIRDFLRTSLKFGCPGVADFREGGVEGLRLGLRAAEGFPTYVPMGRPEALDDPEKVEEELRVLSELTEFVGIPDVHLPNDVLEAVRDSGLRVYVHANESWRSVRECVREYGVTEIERAVELLEPEGIVHCVVLTDRDRELLEELDPVVILCPRSNDYYGLGNPDPGRLRGIRVLLGTDNGMSVEPDPWAEAYHAWIRTGLSPLGALRALTVEAAFVFGLPILEEGRRLSAVGLKGLPLPETVLESRQRLAAHVLQLIKTSRIHVLLGVES